MRFDYDEPISLIYENIAAVVKSIRCTYAKLQ